MGKENRFNIITYDFDVQLYRYTKVVINIALPVQH